jgi:multidrug resistance efflux pump
MKKVNWFYISLIMLIPILIWLLKPDRENEIAFYGIAENLETEINYNYDIVVDQIMVNPGQQVGSGTPIMKISRRKSKEELENQSYQIQTLLAEEKAWKQKKLNEIDAIQIKKERTVQNLQARISKLLKEYDFKLSLTDDNKNASQENKDIYNPLGEQVKQLKEELLLVEQDFKQQEFAINDEISSGSNPYRTRMDQLNAEREFDAEHKIQMIDVIAPEEGLIGTIYCKEAEHVPAFKTLLTFYEPHTGIIKGYVHEDLTLSVNIGDLFVVSSLKNDTVFYEGQVIGLGSRIVEVPARLRKFSHIKTYGREVSISISKDNIFLQMEKVGLKIKPGNSEK